MVPSTNLTLLSHKGSTSLSGCSTTYYLISWLPFSSKVVPKDYKLKLLLESSVAKRPISEDKKSWQTLLIKVFLNDNWMSGTGLHDVQEVLVSIVTKVVAKMQFGVSLPKFQPTLAEGRRAGIRL